MASSAPLHGSELIDCARANASKGIEVASQRCGYGEDLPTFERELKQACASIGVEIENFHDLAKIEPKVKKNKELKLPQTHQPNYNYGFDLKITCQLEMGKKLKN